MRSDQINARLCVGRAPGLGTGQPQMTHPRPRLAPDKRVACGGVTANADCRLTSADCCWPLCQEVVETEHMAAPTNTALVKKALANPEPSTHACTPGAGVTSERYDAYGSVLPCQRIVSVYWLNMGCVARLGLASGDGIIAIVLGLLVLAQWPTSGLWVIGLFIGIDLIFYGAAWIACRWSVGGTIGARSERSRRPKLIECKKIGHTRRFSKTGLKRPKV